MNELNSFDIFLLYLLTVMMTTVLASRAIFYTKHTSEGAGVSPIQIHQDTTWFDHMILAANGNYRPFLTNTAACTALMWLGHWARVRTSCMAPVGRNSRRRVDSWQCREDVSAIHSTRHILDTLQLNAADMPRYQPWTSAVEIAPGSSSSFWSLWVEARKTGTPATSVNSTHRYRQSIITFRFVLFYLAFLANNARNT